MHREHVEIKRDVVRLMRISRLVFWKLGCQSVGREADLVRRAFLAPVLERNRVVGRKGFLGVNREATRVQTMGYPGLSAFGDSHDVFKELGGCEAGDVWSDCLDCLRSQQSNHAKRFEAAPCDHPGTAIRDNRKRHKSLTTWKVSPPSTIRLFLSSDNRLSAVPFFPNTFVSFHVFRRGRPETLSTSPEAGRKVPCTVRPSEDRCRR